MKIEQRNSKLERKIVTALIVSKPVLAGISEKWTKEGLCNSQWSNIVGGWCIKYFNLG